MRARTILLLKHKDEDEEKHKARRARRRGVSNIYMAIGLFVGIAIIALVVGLMFGLTKQVANELNSGNQTYISQTFLDRIDQAENFGGLAIFIGSIVGIFIVLMTLWAVVRSNIG